MTPPMAKTLKLVIFQDPKGNPETIDAGESIAVVGSAGGHVPPDKVAQTLAALGIRKIPVGTKIRELNEYVEVMQRALSSRSENEWPGPIGFSFEVSIAEGIAKEAGIQADPELPIRQKNFADASQALLKNGIKLLESGAWSTAEDKISLAASYAKKGEFSSKELDLALSCVQELKAAWWANLQGAEHEKNIHLEQARFFAKELSISIEKTEQAIFPSSNSGLLMYLQQNPKLAPPQPSLGPRVELHWTWRW